MRLTKRLLGAILEALNARLADEIDGDGLDRRDYEDALEWVRNRIAEQRK